MLVATAAYAACLPLCTHAAGVNAARERATSGVVMMVGGMANDTEPVAPAALIAAPDETRSRQSVVVQPGSAALTDAIRQPSESVAARVMALAPIINEAARIADVDSALLMAVVDVESGGNPQAISPKGASGLMQLMPGTGARHGASNLLDARQNVAAGARYLKELIRQFGDLPLVLAAYNAGEGAVQKYGGQIPPYAETMSYVPKVIARYKWYRSVAPSTVTASREQASDSADGRFFLVGSSVKN